MSPKLHFKPASMLIVFFLCHNDPSIISRESCGYHDYKVKVIKIKFTLFCLQTMYLCKFGQNPSMVQILAQGNLILDISECCCDLENKIKVTKILSTLPLLPTMYLCEFGQNPSTGSEDNAQKPYFGHLKCCCDLENKVEVTKI